MSTTEKDAGQISDGYQHVRRAVPVPDDLHAWAVIAWQQAKALQDIRQDASDEELKRRYGYSQAVIQAMRAMVSRELHQ